MNSMIILTVLLSIASLIYSTFVLVRGIRSIHRIGVRSDDINLICSAVLGYLVAFHAGYSVWVIVFR